MKYFSKKRVVNVTGSKLTRIGVSMDEDLLQQFDELVQQKGYENRSEALRDLVRRNLLEETWNEDNQIIAGSILIFYDHRQRNLMETLTNVQHEMHDLILATTHFHLNAVNCLELIVVKGEAKKIQAMQHKLASLKGVSHSSLTVSPIE